jgi:hypothetical protein
MSDPNENGPGRLNRLADAIERAEEEGCLMPPGFYERLKVSNALALAHLKEMDKQDEPLPVAVAICGMAPEGVPCNGRVMLTTSKVSQMPWDQKVGEQIPKVTVYDCSCEKCGAMYSPAFFQKKLRAGKVE